MRLEVKSYDPLGDGISRLEYIDHMGSDDSILRAARVSYYNDNEIYAPERDEKLLHYLIDHNHTSPLEHTAVTFMVKCPLFIRSQWQRHRMASYNEVSRRYTSEEIDFYIPPTLRVQDTKNRQASIGEYIGDVDFSGLIKEYDNTCYRLYQAMLDQNVARELARMVLPQNLYTRFYYTANLHSILHFYRLRADEHAQPEIQVYAKAISSIMSELYPITWKAVIRKGLE